KAGAAARHLVSRVASCARWRACLVLVCFEVRMYVELSHVSFAHGGGEPILHDVTQRFAPGISAIVGENGAGKSTLLALITRELLPDEGSVRIEPRSAHVALCEQSVETLTPEVRAFA